MLTVLMKTLKQYYQLLIRAIYNMIHVDDFIAERVRFESKKTMLETFAMAGTTKGVSDEIVDDEELVVSLTTHGKRIHSVFRTIESIFQQTYKANKVVLYLGDKEYTSIEQLPITLQRQVDRGLTVRFVKDVRSYTKLVPALKEFPSAAIITVDDDFFYPFDLIERLMNAHKKNPKAVCARVLKKLELIGKNKLKSYDDLERFKSKGGMTDCAGYMPEGYGGVLYPPHCMPSVTIDESLFLSLCPSADDVWFAAVEMCNSIPIVHVPYEFVRTPSSQMKDLLENDDVQDIGLQQTNVLQRQNDVQMKAVFDHFNLYEKLKYTIQNHI